MTHILNLVAGMIKSCKLTAYKTPGSMYAKYQKLEDSPKKPA